MAKAKLGFINLHSPLFFAGKNWGDKLDIRNKDRGKLDMEIDYDTKIITLRCENRECELPHTSAFSWEKAETLAPKVEPTNFPNANPGITAQVSGPHDHVFQGKGAGQTGVGKRVK